jgi:hypothetical protein
MRGVRDNHGDRDDDVEYHLAGLERELLQGLARLKATDGADDHVTWYRDHFYAAVRNLRHALARVGPLGAEVAIQAWQVAFLAHIWPTLKEQRVSTAARALLRTQNPRAPRAQVQHSRCLNIAQTMTHPTAEAIRHRYRTTFPTEHTPAVRTIRRYLAPK